MHNKVRFAAMVILLLVLGIFAVTEWVPVLLFLPAAGGVLLVNNLGAFTPGRTQHDREHPRS